jgi:hypothetical protein
MSVIDIGVVPRAPLVKSLPEYFEVVEEPPSVVVGVFDTEFPYVVFEKLPY